MNIVSLFDGMACGMLAMQGERAKDFCKINT